jgi:hypothetical protein
VNNRAWIPERVRVNFRDANSKASKTVALLFRCHSISFSAKHPADKANKALKFFIQIFSLLKLHDKVTQTKKTTKLTTTFRHHFVKLLSVCILCNFGIDFLSFFGCREGDCGGLMSKCFGRLK